MSEQEIRQQALLETLQNQARTIPGVWVQTGVTCRKVKPSGPEVPNWQMAECGLLLNHEGKHDWELW